MASHYICLTLIIEMIILEDKKENIMLTANEAKENTNAIKEEWHSDSWNAIDLHIQECIKRGEYSTRRMLTIGEREKLKQLGYTVNQFGSGNSETYDIIWE